MTIERRRPLPEGRYWIDITAEDRPKWDTWVEGMKAIPSVTIEKVQHIEATDSQWNPFGEGTAPAAPERDFAIFRLSAPNIAWEAAGLKSPNIAGTDVQGAEDVSQAPPPEPSATEQISTAIGGLGTAAKVGIGVGAAAAVIAVVAAFRR